MVCGPSGQTCSVDSRMGFFTCGAYASCMRTCTFSSLVLRFDSSPPSLLLVMVSIWDGVVHVWFLSRLPWILSLLEAHIMAQPSPIRHWVSQAHQLPMRLFINRLSTGWIQNYIIIYKLFSLLLFQYELQRIDFDEVVSSIQASKDIPTASAVRILLRKFLFFHSNSKDAQRLVSTVSKWRYLK